jgi:holliday junction resolvase YEN1
MPRPRLALQSRSSLSGPEDPSDSENESNDERLFIRIHSTRIHASTDHVLEYRLEIAPAQLVRLARAGIKGIRPPIINEMTDDEDEVSGHNIPILILPINDASE